MSSQTTQPEIGVFGGSGFQKLLEKAEMREIDTPWGRPSASIAVGMFAGKKIAFLPRHGVSHEYPPHAIPYRANIAAFREIGVKRIISPCAVGSLQRHVAPGNFVVCDQLVDRTKQRGDTFYDSPSTGPTTHISFADPYCPELRRLATQACETAGVTMHPSGTVVVVEGPRFSTRAESRWFTSQGWEVINMTQYPEAALAREKECCFVNISLVTDWDTGFSLDSGIEAVTVDKIIEVSQQNNKKLIDVLEVLIASLPPAATASCQCKNALEHAQL